MRTHTHVTSHDLFDIPDTSCSFYYCILQLSVNPKLYLSVVVFVILLIVYCRLLRQLQTSQLATRMATNLMGQMEPYEVGGPEEWATYIERLEQFFVANKVTEGRQKKAVLLTVGLRELCRNNIGNFEVA